MKVMRVELLLFFSLKFLMIVFFFFCPAVAGNKERFRVTPPISSG